MKSYAVAPLNVRGAKTKMIENGDIGDVAAAVNSIIDIRSGFDTCEDDKTVAPWLQQFLDKAEPGDAQKICCGERVCGYVKRIFN